MSLPLKKDIEVHKGATFTATVRFDTGVPTYKAITAIGKTAPARITCVGHGVPDGWSVAVVSVQGMTEINSSDEEDRSTFTIAKVIDEDTLDLPFVNAAEYSTYLSGGYVKYFTPEDISGYKARFQIKESIYSDTAIVELDEDAGVVVDSVNKTFTVTVPAATTAALGVVQGVYGFEAEASDGTVYPLMDGGVEIVEEVPT